MLLAMLLVPSGVLSDALSNSERNSHPTEPAQSCQIDLDRDGREDLAVFMRTGEEHELVVLLSRLSGYETRSLFHGEPSLVLACKLGDSVVETTAARHAGARHETGGTYLTLSQPEGASFAFYWAGSKFQEVQASD